MSKIKRTYNLKVERLHPNKLTFMTLPIKPPIALPTCVDLRPKMQPIYDQG